jgi:hypothetical protein
LRLAERLEREAEPVQRVRRLGRALERRQEVVGGPGEVAIARRELAEREVRLRAARIALDPARQEDCVGAEVRRALRADRAAPTFRARARRRRARAGASCQSGSSAVSARDPPSDMKNT